MAFSVCVRTAGFAGFRRIGKDPRTVPGIFSASLVQYSPFSTRPGCRPPIEVFATSPAGVCVIAGSKVRDGCPRFPGFPVEFGGVDGLHAAFLTESRTRGPVWCCVTGNPGTPERTWAEKDMFRMLFLGPARDLLAIEQKQLWASPVFFGPGTPWRTWGTRPIPSTLL